MESPGTKPDCRDVITLFALKKFKTCFCTIFSITFSSVLSNGIGLYFLQSEWWSFLNNGVTLASRLSQTTFFCESFLDFTRTLGKIMFGISSKSSGSRLIRDYFDCTCS